MKFGGMEATDAKRLRELESENAKLKALLAETPLHMPVPKRRPQRKKIASQVERKTIGRLMGKHQMCKRHACTLWG